MPNLSNGFSAFCSEREKREKKKNERSCSNFEELLSIFCKMFWNSVNIAALMRKVNRQGVRDLKDWPTELGMHK